MKILFPTIINLENFDNSNIYIDLIKTLVKNGHEVVLLTPREKKYSKETEFYLNDSVRILAVKTGNLFNINYIEKGISNFLISTIYMNAYKKYLINENFDLILYHTPPVTLASFIQKVKKITNSKTYLMLKDIWPQSLIDLGVINRVKFIIPLFRKNEKKLYRISDKIGCMSNGNVKYIMQHNRIDASKVELFYNSIILRDQKIKRDYENCNETTFIFGGTLGRAQNIRCVLDIINQLAHYDKAKFLIIGSGTESYLIEEFINNKNPKNLLYTKQLPKLDFEKHLQQSHVGLISLDPNFTIPNIPSKMLDYMTFKMPILALTDVYTDLKDIIYDADCGWWCDASDIDNIILTIKSICENSNNYKEKGENGYHYLCKNFDVRTSVEKLEHFMNGFNY